MPKKSIAFAVCFLVAAGFGLFAMAGTQAQQVAPEKTGTNAIVGDYEINEMVDEIESVHCNRIETAAIEQKLSPQLTQKVRDFCRLSHDEKVKFLKTSFIANGDKKSTLTGISHSYYCTYRGGYNTNIPNYADMGLTASKCSWHDSSPVACKNERGVACLWGCTNTDSVLGWHTKYFASRTALEKEIGPKGYHRIGDNYGGDYRRWLSYGYSYQVNPLSADSNGKGTWHGEGPESNPEFPNWHAIINAWYLPEIKDWHDSC